MRLVSMGLRSKAPSALAAAPVPVDDDVDDEVFEEEDVSMPPLRAPRPVSSRPDSIPDLSKLARTWMLIGCGGSGKTMLARWLGGNLAERGLLDRSLLAALRSDKPVAGGVLRLCASAQHAAGVGSADFLVRMVAHTTRRQMSGIWDFGGGDLSLASLVETDPKFDATMEADGCAVVAAYVLSPAVDNLAMLRSFEAAGFQPRATALVLDLGMADNPASFGALQAQAIYKAALTSGEQGERQVDAAVEQRRDTGVPKIQARSARRWLRWHGRGKRARSPSFGTRDKQLGRYGKAPDIWIARMARRSRP